MDEDELSRALEGAAETLAKLPPARPDGEKDDTATVTELRRVLAGWYLELYGENLAMRPTIELVNRLAADARQYIKG